MAEINQGRWTAHVEGDFVVFLIGARLQAAPPAPRRCATSAASSAGMQGDAEAISAEHPEKPGCLGFQQLGIGTVNVQYWRSFADLERFAKDDGDPHLAAVARPSGSGSGVATAPGSGTRPTCAGWGVRGDLRQHAAVRARQGHRPPAHRAGLHRPQPATPGDGLSGPTAPQPSASAELLVDGVGELGEGRARVGERASRRTRSSARAPPRRSGWSRRRRPPRSRDRGRGASAPAGRGMSLGASIESELLMAAIQTQRRPPSPGGAQPLT